MAELRLLEAEALLRRQTLTPRLDLARRAAQDLATKVSVGLAQRVELAEAELRVRELELDLYRADYELALIERQLKERKGGK